MRLRLPAWSTAMVPMVFASATVLVADVPAQLPFRNLRTLDAQIYATVMTCYGQSPTCRRVIDEIESSTTIVYLRRGRCDRLRGGSCVQFAGASGRDLYLHLLLDGEQSGDCLLPLAAHELQHVLEASRAPNIVDVSSFRSLFERIGFFIRGSGMREEWETDEAQRIALVVSKEIRRSQRADLARK